jgi:general stress protein 26
MLERALTIIKTIEYLTIASVCPNGLPWNTPVFTSYDSNLNFYWGSYKENQHSLNIMNNNNVFCVLYDSRAKEGTGEGLYLEGYADMLTDNETMQYALNMLMKRSGHFGKNTDNYKDDKPRRLYRFIPERIWMNDGDTKNGEYIDIRTQIDKQRLCALCASAV